MRSGNGLLTPLVDSTACALVQRFAIKLEKLPPPAEPPPDDVADADPLRQAQAAAAARAVLKLEAVILSKLQKYPFV